MNIKLTSISVKVLVLITALLFAMIFFGCGGEQNNNLNTSQKTEPEPEPKTWEEQLRQDYLTKLQSEGEYPELTVDDVWIKKYYGTYNGWAAVMMDSTGMEYDVGVQDVIMSFWYEQRVVIRYTDSNRILLWKDGDFYKFENVRFALYANDPPGLLVLSQYDVCNIINIQNGFSGKEWQMMWNDLTYYLYGSSPEKGDIIGWGDEYNIQDLIENDLKECFIFQNLGIYDGYMVVSVKAVSGGVRQTERFYLIVGGTRFYYLATAVGHYNLLRVPVDETFVYKDGIFSPLWDAYWDDGLLSSLTPEQFAELAYFHNAGTAWE